jgi:hypothetical protein
VPVATDQKVRARRVLEGGRSSAAPRCSNQTDLRLTLADLFYGSDLPERPSPTSTDLVCIQMVKPRRPDSLALLRTPPTSLRVALWHHARMVESAFRSICEPARPAVDELIQFTDRQIYHADDL